jgi:hypothetical protein
MKLITEVNENVAYKILTEEKSGNKNYFIEGIFMQAEVTNRNGRSYPKEMLQKEIMRYVGEYVEKNRAFGELGHPDGPTINLDRVSHMVTELREDGDNFIGRAKILTELPNGKIVKAFIDAGASLGVSSRGMGSLKTEGTDTDVVQDDFYLVTAGDIVADPSAPEAFVNGIMEGKEWIWANGLIKEKHIAKYKKTIDKAPAKKIQEISIQAFANFMHKLSRR